MCVCLGLDWAYFLHFMSLVKCVCVREKQAGESGMGDGESVEYNILTHTETHIFNAQIKSLKRFFYKHFHFIDT